MVIIDGALLTLAFVIRGTVRQIIIPDELFRVSILLAETLQMIRTFLKEFVFILKGNIICVI